MRIQSKSLLIMLTGVLAGYGASVHAFPAVNTLQSSFEHKGAFIAVSSDVNDEVAGARDFINDVAQRGLGFLQSGTLTEEERKKEFRTLLEDSFDMNTIARFSLGRYWRQASEGQRSEYLKLFNEMIIDVYARRFGEYNGQTLSVTEARQEGKKDMLVTSVISSPSGPDVQVDWRVRRKDGRYKIVDIMVEGVSMALTQRSDFSSVIQRGGGQVNVLIAHLKKNGPLNLSSN